MPLLLTSITVNYLFGDYVLKNVSSEPQKKLALYSAITLNLLVLCFYKYANFFAQNANIFLEQYHVAGFQMINVVLPLGISFFTFTQISYLVDAYRGETKKTGFVHYLLFVTYFPHLIAGPILHHKQMMRQFKAEETYRINAQKIAAGLTIFIIGLTKKIYLADPMGGYSDMLFNNVEAGLNPTFLFSWIGALAYTFQIYFDFSGYSDMAIGISLMFGIVLPINFYSPYKATSIIEFWRRWHITLSHFLRDYLYFSLGGNRLGIFRRYLNLFITMLLGGLWHGANWTFVIWGGVHGAYLAINHYWRQFRNKKPDHEPPNPSPIYWTLTFISVIFAWVMFRSNNVQQALAVYKGMLGVNGVSIPSFFAGKLSQIGTFGSVTYGGIFDSVALDGGLLKLVVLFVCSFVVILALPPSCRFIPLELRGNNEFPAQEKGLIDTSPRRGYIFGILFFLCVLSLEKLSPFLYFQF